MTVTDEKPSVSFAPVTPTGRTIAIYTNGNMAVQLVGGLRHGYLRGSRDDIEEWLFWLSADLAGLPDDAAPGWYRAEQGQVTT